MTLEEILPELRKGKKIWRRAWEMKYSHLQDNIRLSKPRYEGDYVYPERLFSREAFAPLDILADDWEIFTKEQ